jgi:hypothetical protein
MQEEITSDWIGIDYVGMLEMQMEEGGTGDDPMAMGAAGGAAMAQLLGTMADYVTVERLDDVDLGDQPGAAFSYTFDIIGFLSSDEFSANVREMLAAVGEDTSSSDLDEGLAMIGFVAPMLFRDLDVNMQTVIGEDDKLMYSQTFDLTWDLASLMQFAAMSDPALAEAMGDAEPAISFNFASDYADFNDEMIFEVPDDVQMIPLEQLVPQDTSAVF